jgi:hypothetical protein
MDDQQIDYSTGRTRRVEYPRPAETDRVDPKLSLDDLNERRAVISAALSERAEFTDSIKNQLEAAEVTQAATGVPTNPDWLRRANGAMRYFARQHQDHQRALGNLNRRASQLGQSSGKQADRKAFIRHARAVLPPETYDAIWARANAELRGADRAA